MFPLVHGDISLLQCVAQHGEEARVSRHPEGGGAGGGAGVRWPPYVRLAGLPVRGVLDKGLVVGDGREDTRKVGQHQSEDPGELRYQTG